MQRNKITVSLIFANALLAVLLYLLLSDSGSKTNETSSSIQIQDQDERRERILFSLNHIVLEIETLQPKISTFIERSDINKRTRDTVNHLKTKLESLKTSVKSSIDEIKTGEPDDVTTNGEYILDTFTLALEDFRLKLEKAEINK